MIKKLSRRASLPWNHQGKGTSKRFASPGTPKNGRHYVWMAKDGHPSFGSFRDNHDTFKNRKRISGRKHNRSLD